MYSENFVTFRPDSLNFGQRDRRPNSFVQFLVIMLAMSAVMMPTAQLAAIPSTAQLPIVQNPKFDPKYMLNHNPQVAINNSKAGM
ncbi:hypothetical protein PGB90_000658 [Kerria lacca]